MIIFSRFGAYISKAILKTTERCSPLQMFNQIYSINFVVYHINTRPFRVVRKKSGFRLCYVISNYASKTTLTLAN